MGELFPTEIPQDPKKYHKYLVIRYPEFWPHENLPVEHLSFGYSYVYTKNTEDVKTLNENAELQIIEYRGIKNVIYGYQLQKEISFQDFFRDKNGCFYESTGSNTRDYRDNNIVVFGGIRDKRELIRDYIDNKLNEMVAIKPAE